MTRRVKGSGKGRQSWLLHTGLDYVSAVTGRARRAEPFDVVDDLPPASTGWLAEQGHIGPIQQATYPDGASAAEARADLNGDR
jgi:hypothetical protein